MTFGLFEESSIINEDISPNKNIHTQTSSFQKITPFCKCKSILSCLFFLQNISYLSNGSESHSVVSNSLQPCGLYSPWNSPGQNTGVGSLSLLQEIFPTPGIRPRCPTLQADSLPAEPPGKPIFIYFHLFLPLPIFITLPPRLKSMPPACLPEVYSILSKPYSDADGILIVF